MTVPDFTFSKQPAEKITVTVDYTDFVSSPAPFSSVVATAAIRPGGGDTTAPVIDSALVIVGTNKITLTFKEGAADERHDIRLVLNGSDGQIYESDGLLVIEEKGKGA